MRLETLAARTTQPELASELDGLREDAAAAVERLRRLLFEIQPVELERSGVGVALKVCSRAGERRGRAGTSSSTTAPLAGPPRPSARFSTGWGVRRWRTSGSMPRPRTSRCTSTTTATAFSLKVRDDGKGFDAEQGLRVRPGHLGLPAMRERVEIAGGRLKVESRPGTGTALQVWLPDFELQRIRNARP